VCCIGCPVFACQPGEYCDRTAYTVHEYGLTPENKAERGSVFRSDYRKQEERAKGLAIVNHDLLDKMSASPANAFYPDDNSSRKSSSRRTESISSDYSIVEQQRPRNNGGYGSTSRSNIRSFEGQAPTPVGRCQGANHGEDLPNCG
jgi:hypothetical protein